GDDQLRPGERPTYSTPGTRPRWSSHTSFWRRSHVGFRHRTTTRWAEPGSPIPGVRAPDYEVVVVSRNGCPPRSVPLTVTWIGEPVPRSGRSILNGPSLFGTCSCFVSPSMVHVTAVMGRAPR